MVCVYIYICLLKQSWAGNNLFINNVGQKAKVKEALSWQAAANAAVALRENLINTIPFAFVVRCLLDRVSKLFHSRSTENLGTWGADVEGLWKPKSVSWQGTAISDISDIFKNSFNFWLMCPRVKAKGSVSPF